MIFRFEFDFGIWLRFLSSKQEKRSNTPIISLKKLRIEKSLYKILQLLSITLFEQVPIFQALTDVDHKDSDDSNCKQLDLFDF